MTTNNKFDNLSMKLLYSMLVAKYGKVLFSMNFKHSCLMLFLRSMVYVDFQKEIKSDKLTSYTANVIDIGMIFDVICGIACLFLLYYIITAVVVL